MTVDEKGPAQRLIEGFKPKTPRDDMAMRLFKAWVEADPESNVAKNPASYLANFVDMADAALAYEAAKTAEGAVGISHALCNVPGWEYATTEGPRKSWTTEDEPPEGNGWERNLDKGHMGWERFDYTEEAYWRRPSPAPGAP